MEVTAFVPTVSDFIKEADMPGVIEKVVYSESGYGHHVIINHVGLRILYGHLGLIAVREGDVVSAGTIVALSSDTEGQRLLRFPEAYRLCREYGQLYRQSPSHSKYTISYGGIKTGDAK